MIQNHALRSEPIALSFATFNESLHNVMVPSGNDESAIPEPRGRRETFNICSSLLLCFPQALLRLCSQLYLVIYFKKMRSFHAVFSAIYVALNDISSRKDVVHLDRSWGLCGSWVCYAAKFTQVLRACCNSATERRYEFRTVLWRLWVARKAFRANLMLAGPAYDDTADACECGRLAIQHTQEKAIFLANHLYVCSFSAT